MSDNKPKFQKLTPIQNADIGIYSDALNCVFESKDLRNIAVSGAYSAGKSSVMESYKAKHNEKQFIHISLAHFEEAIQNTELVIPKQNENKLENFNESMLEGKILNQLIHQIPPNQIPQTNFRIKSEIVPIKVLLWAASVIGFILMFLHIIFFDNWKVYVDSIATTWIKDILSLSAKNSSAFISATICAVLATFLLYQIITVQINKGVFKKLKADKFEIEIFEGSEDSYFDKYLNEVLYLFEKCGADAIVFEDIDRYNNNGIFERLREVNNLINVQRSKRRDTKPLRFFYLLRDDIFVTKDRTKFFDFIIPVVPVVDGSNSYDQFIKHLTDSGVWDLFDEAFLQGLSLYIDDMRILKNICNEFLIYNSRLNITELNHNKLMAMITYKNLFPRDFSDLQLGRGFVFTLFDKKEQFTDEKVSRLASELTAARERLDAASKEHLVSISELDLSKNDKTQTINRQNPYNHQQREISLHQMEIEYATRKQAIEDRNNEQLPILEDRIRRLEREITATKNQTLSEVITRESISEVFATTSESEIGIKFDFKDVRGNAYFALLKYLIRNGHINESYADYMTYFYERSLSLTDKIFLRSIYDQIKKEPNYQLKEPKKVVARLNIAVFDQSEVLNFDLLFYLLQHCSVCLSVPPIYHPAEVPTFPLIHSREQKEPQLLTAMIKLILSQGDYAFLNLVFLNICDERLNYLVNFLNANQNDCLERILVGKAEFAPSSRDEFVFRTLIVTPDCDLIEVESLKEALSSFISEQADFLNAERLNEDLLKSMFGNSIQKKLLTVTLLTRLETLGVRFHAINHEVADDKLFEQVFMRSLYELNYGNIALMLKTQYTLSESEDFKHKNYTLIRMQPDSPLSSYVDENIDDYIKEIVAYCDGEICDDAADALAIMNNVSISDKHKDAYIDVLITVTQNLADVNDTSLWQHLLTADLVLHTEENVLDYYCECACEMTEELVAFLNGQDNQYNYTSIRSLYDAEIQSKFFNSVLRCNMLNNKHYRNILKTLKRVYSSGFSVENVENDKILILINIGVIAMHLSSLLFFREHYPDFVMPYIQKYTSAYIDEISGEDNFHLDEAQNVLLLEVEDTYKLELLRKIESPLTAKKHEYSDAVRAHILSNNLDKDDIVHFIGSYPSEGEMTKAVVEKIACDEIQMILDRKYSIDKILVDKLLISNASQDTKLQLFTLLLPSLDGSQCKYYLGQLGLNEFLSLFDHKRPKIQINDTHSRMLKTFRDKGWITKFEEDEKENGYYRAYGRKAHSANAKKKR